MPRSPSGLPPHIARWLKEASEHDVLNRGGAKFVSAGPIGSDRPQSEETSSGSPPSAREVAPEPDGRSLDPRSLHGMEGRVTTDRRHARAPRLALTKREAAGALGMSVDSFERHVQSELRVVRRGRLRLFALTEIERWLHENGTKTIDLS